MDGVSRDAQVWATLAKIRLEAARRVQEWEPWMTLEVGYGGAGVFCYSHDRWETTWGGCAGRQR